jgi:hypothetical protein
MSIQFDIPEEGVGELGERKVIVLEPKNWYGRTFPLRKHVAIDENLEKGTWTIILFRIECERCRKLIDRLRKTTAEKEPETRMALIEVPPFSGEAEKLINGYPHLVYGQLSPELEWFVQTPAIIQVVNGRVRRVFSAGQAGLFGDLLAGDCDHCGRRIAVAP